MTQVSIKRVKFASQMEPDLYEGLKAVAQQDGRQIQAVLEDAVRAYIENRKGPKRFAKSCEKAKQTKTVARQKCRAFLLWGTT